MYLNNFIDQFDEPFVKAIKDKYVEKQNNIVHEISFLHLEIVEFLKPLGIQFAIEQRFYGLDMDVLFFEKDGSTPIAVLEIHGYQHFLRNVNVLTGDSYLKQKIVENILGEDNYYVIEIFTWHMLANDKKSDFLKTMLSRLIVKDDSEQGLKSLE